jgi:hypothetical protein
MYLSHKSQSWRENDEGLITSIVQDALIRVPVGAIEEKVFQRVGYASINVAKLRDDARWTSAFDDTEFMVVHLE